MPRSSRRRATPAVSATMCRHQPSLLGLRTGRRAQRLRLRPPIWSLDCRADSGSHVRSATVYLVLVSSLPHRPDTGPTFEEETVVSDHMAWLALGVLVLVGLVLGLVVPRRARRGTTPGFPWFWVAFPATCMTAAAAVAVFAWPHVLSGSGRYWWEPPTVNRPGLQFLSSEQYQRFVTLRRCRWVLPAVSLVGVGWCVWAWRRRRV
jgi:hypothetical protein